MDIRNIKFNFLNQFLQQDESEKIFSKIKKLIKQ